MLELTIPSSLLPVILLLENSATQEEREEAMRQLKVLSETVPELEAFFKGQAPESAEPREVAKKLREYCEQKITPAKNTEASFSCSLDPESTENIRRELRKTYKENNISFIANGTPHTTLEWDIGLSAQEPSKVVASPRVTIEDTLLLLPKTPVAARSP